MLTRKARQRFPRRAFSRLQGRVFRVNPVGAPDAADPPWAYRSAPQEATAN